jgi:hypothetical protein
MPVAEATRMLSCEVDVIAADKEVAVSNKLVAVA